MTRSVAIRTVGQLMVGVRGRALFIANTGVAHFDVDSVLTGELRRECQAVAAWLREIADGLAKEDDE